MTVQVPGPAERREVRAASWSEPQHKHCGKVVTGPLPSVAFRGRGPQAGGRPTLEWSGRPVGPRSASKVPRRVTPPLRVGMLPVPSSVAQSDDGGITGGRSEVLHCILFCILYASHILFYLLILCFGVVSFLLLFQALPNTSFDVCLTLQVRCSVHQRRLAGRPNVISLSARR